MLCFDYITRYDRSVIWGQIPRFTVCLLAAGIERDIVNDSKTGGFASVAYFTNWNHMRVVLFYVPGVLYLFKTPKIYKTCFSQWPYNHFLNERMNFLHLQHVDVRLTDLNASVVAWCLALILLFTVTPSSCDYMHLFHRLLMRDGTLFLCLLHGQKVLSEVLFLIIQPRCHSQADIGHFASRNSLQPSALCSRLRGSQRQHGRAAHGQKNNSE